MQTRTKFEIVGTIAGLGTFFLTAAGRVSNVFGVLGLPSEVVAALMLMSAAPTAVTVIALLIGLFCVGYLIRDSGWFSRESSAISIAGRSRQAAILKGFLMWPSIGIIIGGMIFIVSVAWMLNDNRRAVHEISQVLSRYVLPRHLSEQQIKTISDYLSQHEPQKFKMAVTKNNGEANGYASDIRQALVNGGWELVSTDYNTEFTQAGIAAQFQESLESARHNDPKHPKPPDLLNGAFKSARVTDLSIGRGSGSSITENSFIISIGNRRMDDGDLIGKRIMREQALRTLQETE